MKKSYIILLFTVFACASKTEHEKVLQENESLKLKLYRKQKEIDSIKLDKEIESILNSKQKEYSKEDVRMVLFNYYKFYERDMVFRKELITKIDKNIFEISLEEGTKSLVKKSNSDVFWNTAVYRLTIINDSKYNIDRVR